MYKYTHMSARDTRSKKICNNSMSSKVFDTITMEVIEFYPQVATIVKNTLTILEFYVLFYKNLKMGQLYGLPRKLLCALQGYVSNLHPNTLCHIPFWCP